MTNMDIIAARSTARRWMGGKVSLRAVSSILARKFEG